MATTQRFGNVKIHLPNIVFKIIPDPRLGKNQAAFRVPLQVNKLDIKDYLTHIYNVTVTDVRTVVLPGKIGLNPYTAQMERSSRIKKAIVTIKEEFTYPKDPNVDKDFGGLESKYQKVLRGNKLKGWRSSRTSEETELFSQVYEQRKLTASKPKKSSKKQEST
ncbi:mitochondrial 54S ribosomal protein YmL41 [Coemansia spiralis]|uniref:Large ribosomal subunit protein uL23m n=1 Tax=Coemansia spiralis TaxID=417178 RepID=A0A9W8G284_9FUNG|nr:ribosomal protein L23-domain-containing protein [Coemansia spiralis]KAJ2619357.1 mitochondrial 54S ribosomal protein YmL41 [Coemansia sp. RSA 1358]KAJ2668625.1 mitochondrial 54S ribosomal protein YmL41 [Coemansia spiralis]